MHESAAPASRARRCFAAAGALSCALAIALGAYAAQTLDAAARARMDIALLYLFLHGVALAWAAPRQRTRLELAALAGWLAGTLMFSGSLILATLWGMPSILAPAGGTLLIAAWVVQGVSALRR